MVISVVVFNFKRKIQQQMKTKHKFIKSLGIWLLFFIIGFIVMFFAASPCQMLFKDLLTGRDVFFGCLGSGLTSGTLTAWSWWYNQKDN